MSGGTERIHISCGGMFEHDSIFEHQDVTASGEL